MQPPVTDPYHLIVLGAIRSTLAYSALPDAPVLPVVESRRARARRALQRLAGQLAARRPSAVAHRPARAATCV